MQSILSPRQEDAFEWVAPNFLREETSMPGQGGRLYTDGQLAGLPHGAAIDRSFDGPLGEAS